MSLRKLTGDGYLRSMLKILNAGQIRSCDAYTIENEPIASIDLMERACRAFVAWFTTRFDTAHKIGIICGTGNNGGDGLGIARLLTDRGYSVKVWVVRGDVKETQDFAKNLERIAGKIDIDEITSVTDGLFYSHHILVDAIFGSGLSRPVEGIYARTISSINTTPAIRVSVDIPSGLMADKHSTGFIVSAHHTVSFQLPKLAFLFPENYKYAGEWHRVDIGLSKKYLHEAQVSHFYVTLRGIKKKIKTRSKFDNKGDHGKALLIAGSYGKMGACILAARAALRSGLGLLTVHVPRSGYSIIQTAVPEAMAKVDAHENFFTHEDSIENYTAIGIGPGLGQEQTTADGLINVLDQCKPMVIDADALNILSTRKELYKSIPDGSVLTPHPKEFERLVGPWSDDFQRLEKQKQLAAEMNAIIVVKGAHTSIATPEGKVYFNSTGNAAMATGGTGDVLTGLLTGLLAQGYSSEDSALIGVYLHGLSGDLWVRERGLNSLIASDLIDQFPQAFRKIAG